MRGNFLTYTLTILCSTVCQSIYAQARETDLLKIDSAYKRVRRDAETRISKYLKEKPLGRIAYRKDGSMMALVDVSASGMPIYIQSDNAQVATSLRVDGLRSGGGLGLNLEGSGIEVGIWDEGKVRDDHVEYAGRVVQMDGATEYNFHASHVLGTMIATGINANAKGMAPKATAIAYDFFNDVSEMAGRAAPGQSSLLLSNHSYGTVSGWSKDGGTWTWFGDPAISTTKDWKFGFYNSTSAFYDGIAYNAPYYLIVKSAGNDNADVGDGSRPPDCDPYDCIPTNGVAKNILTVGAVKKLFAPYSGPSDVEITGFSSFGPADDGRIKPDIVAPGQAVFSTSAASPNDYEVLSGTSMSAPAVTGTLALLQELYKNLNGGSYMKSATLKALAIHTAREAGPNEGPDYMFGWGLLDAEGAAKTLMEKDGQNIFVEELTLSNGGVYQLDLQPRENTKITATLVWTDPEGQVLPPSLNPTVKMLKNDLDLSLSDDGGTTQFPWKLDPANPAWAATKGDNSVDNVEKLEFDLPEPRNYKLKVSHKGALVNGQQDFSLILTYTSVIDPRVSYYWIGNSGNWNDGTNWSLESGGTPALAAPSTEDNVVFDENSFSSDGQTVAFANDGQCYSIRWFTNENTSLDFAGHELSIGNGINLLSENITSASPGTLLFNRVGLADAKVNLNNTHLEDVALKFLGEGSTWTLLGDFTVDRIALEAGHLSVGPNQIKLNVLDGSGPQAKTLSLASTGITGATSLSIDLSSLVLESENASVAVPPLSSYHFNTGANDFNGRINLAGGRMTISGNGAIDTVEGFGELIVNGGHTWNNIHLGEGSSWVVGESTTQILANAFDLQATPANRTALASSGAGMATLEFQKHKKICLDNLDIVNVQVTGEATLNAGANSTVVNSPNWWQDACSNILFPDFDFEYNCENAAVFFIDKSSGPVSSWQWDFGDVGTAQNTSSATNPIHLFEGPGPFQISLTVSNGTGPVGYTKALALGPTELLENKVELENGKLISFLPANSYQWVLDGELLENTNKRSIGLSAGLGVYSVLTFDGDCNRQSKPFLVTGGLAEPGQRPIEVYPNPAERDLFVAGEDIKKIRLLDQVGREIAISPTETNDGFRLPTSGLSKGVYFLQVHYGQRVSYHRVVVR